MQGKLDTGKLEMESDLKSLLHQLEPEIYEKAKKLKETYLLELQAMTETIIKDKQTKIKEVTENLITANNDIITVKKREHLVSYLRPGGYDNEEEAAKTLLDACNTLTEHACINEGETDQKIKLDLAKLGYPVKNRYDYDGIKLEIENIVNESSQRLTTLYEMGRFPNLSHFLTSGRQSIVERFPAPLDRFVQTISNWQNMNSERASHVHAEYSEQFHYLKKRMDAGVAEQKLQFRFMQATLTDPNKSQSACVQPYHFHLQHSQNVIDCLMHDVSKFHAGFKVAMDRAVYHVAAVNRDLESMGL